MESSTVPGHNSPGRRRLYQKGSQKIAGFQFGASVTMDMEERFYDTATAEGLQVDEMRRIAFKCVDSQFFRTFDGSWTVKQKSTPTSVETQVEYVVDVRPKGVVPVVALEWRIREDVPTNLVSVKEASVRRGEAGGGGEPDGKTRMVAPPPPPPAVAAAAEENGDARNSKRERVRDFVRRFERGKGGGPDWGKDETLAAYRKKD